jgi:hypothetical protein
MHHHLHWISYLPLLGFAITAMTVAIAAAATSLVGTGISVYGQLQAGKAANALANYNANQEQINAQAAMRDADVRANAIRERNRLTEARQRAAYGASGVTGDTGSPLQVEMWTHQQNEMHALEVERQGTIEAGKDLQTADIDRIEGKNALTASRIGAAGTLIKGIGSAAGSIAGGMGGGGGGNPNFQGTDPFE